MQANHLFLENKLPFGTRLNERRANAKILEAPSLCWYPGYLGCKINHRNCQSRYVQKAIVPKKDKCQHCTTNQCETNELAAKCPANVSFGLWATWFSKCFAGSRNVFLYPEANFSFNMILEICLKFDLNMTQRNGVFGITGGTRSN